MSNPERARAAIALPLAVLIAGCVVPKRAGFDDVEALVAGRTTVKPRWHRGTAEDAAVARRVDELARADLTVNSATELALLENPRLQAVYERLGVAQAEVVQAGLLKNPSFGAHVGFPIGGGLTELNASIAGDFLDLFLIPLRKRFAKAEFQRVKLEVADAVLELTADVRAAFYTAQASAAVLAVRRTILDGERAAVELAVEQHRAGNLSDLDLTVEQASYAQAKLDAARGEAQHTADREKLTRMLGLWGRRAGFTITPSLPPPPLEDPPLDHLESVAVTRRLDLAAANEEVRTAGAALALQKGTRVIGGLDGYGDAHRDPDGPLTVGPTLHVELPIFDQKQAAVARLRALLKAAEDRRDALAIDVRSQVREARARLGAARATAEFYQQTMLPLRERVVGLAREQYDAMLLGVYQLIAAKQSEANGYREYLEAVRDYWIARSDLERALGVPLGFAHTGGGK